MRPLGNSHHYSANKPICKLQADPKKVKRDRSQFRICNTFAVISSAHGPFLHCSRSANNATRQGTARISTAAARRKERERRPATVKHIV